MAYILALLTWLPAGVQCVFPIKVTDHDCACVFNRPANWFPSICNCFSFLVGRQTWKERAGNRKKKQLQVKGNQLAGTGTGTVFGEQLQSAELFVTLRVSVKPWLGYNPGLTKGALKTYNTQPTISFMVGCVLYVFNAPLLTQTGMNDSMMMKSKSLYYMPLRNQAPWAVESREQATCDFTHCYIAENSSSHLRFFDSDFMHIKFAGVQFLSRVDLHAADCTGRRPLPGFDGFLL